MMPLISNARMFAIRKSLLRGRHRCYERLRDGAGPTRIRLSPPLPLMIFWSLVIAGLETPKPGLGSRFGLMTPNVRSNLN
jgi:hypothetical protein